MLKKIKAELKKRPSIVRFYHSVKKYKVFRVVAGKNNDGRQIFVSGKAPSWYNSELTNDTKDALNSGAPVFLYIPWIVEHGNTLIDRISGSGQDYKIKPLYLTENYYDNNVRRRVFSFARDKPTLYRKMIVKKLLPYRSQIKGLIVTFDWAPVMRIVVSVCHELDIPVILIPHESVFADREKYYWDPISKASMPISDYILGWGGLQQEIFLERGYPKERFFAVGAPKFDVYKLYEPKLSRQQYCALFGLDGGKKTILFASQPLDSQFDINVARQSQRQAISDLMDFCEKMEAQLVVRLPPSKDDILGSSLYQRIASSCFGAVDDANFYMVPPEEAIYHADIVTSVNSTMLFEAVLMGRIPLSVKYVDFDQIWTNVGIPAVKTREQLFGQAADMLEHGWTPNKEGLKWAATMFSCGQFDGKASDRIASFLENFSKARVEKIAFKYPDKKSFDVIATSFSGMSDESLKNKMAGLIGYRTLLDIEQCNNYYAELSAVDVFIEWEGMPQHTLVRQRVIQKNMGKSALSV